MKCLVNPWSFPVFLRFVVQRYCGREKHQVPLKLLDGELSGSLPQFVQIGYSVKFSVLTLALFSPVSAVRGCT